MSKSILRDNTYTQILAAILDGRIAPGEGLREERLAAELNVSRTPIREALRKLSEEGFVLYEPHRGARLLTPTAEMAREVSRIWEGLGATAAREAAVRMDAETRASLRRHFDVLRPRVRVGDLSDVGDSIHAAMFDHCGNQRLVQLSAVLQGQVKWLQTFAVNIPARPARAFREHLRILLALEAQDAEGAETAVRTHIQRTLADLLRAFRTAPGQPG